MGSKFSVQGNGEVVADVKIPVSCGEVLESQWLVEFLPLVLIKAREMYRLASVPEDMIVGIALGGLHGHRLSYPGRYTPLSIEEPGWYDERQLFNIAATEDVRVTLPRIAQAICMDLTGAP